VYVSTRCISFGAHFTQSPVSWWGSGLFLLPKRDFGAHSPALFECFVSCPPQRENRETATAHTHWDPTVFRVTSVDSAVATAAGPAKAAQKAIQDTFIKTEGRRPPDSEALAQLENETGLFVVGIIEGEHDNLNEIVDHYDQW